MGFGLPGLIGSYFADKKMTQYVLRVMELCLIYKNYKRLKTIRPQKFSEHNDAI